MQRGLLWLSLSAGSFAGAYLPTLAGASALSPVSLFGALLGALVGVSAAVRLDVAR